MLGCTMRSCGLGTGMHPEWMDPGLHLGWMLSLDIVSHLCPLCVQSCPQRQATSLFTWTYSLGPLSIAERPWCLPLHMCHASWQSGLN
jgi:hypothetical protein